MHTCQAVCAAVEPPRLDLTMCVACLAAFTKHCILMKLLFEAHVDAGVYVLHGTAGKGGIWSSGCNGFCQCSVWT
jgi:hypothetical protein